MANYQCLILFQCPDLQKNTIQKLKKSWNMQSSEWELELQAVVMNVGRTP